MLDRRSFLGLVGAAAFAGDPKLDPSGPIVETGAGKLRGRTQAKVYAFRGIPYGATTEGSGRFLPPSKPQPWTGIRDAFEFGPASPQVPSNLIPEAMALQP